MTTISFLRRDVNTQLRTADELLTLVQAVQTSAAGKGIVSVKWKFGSQVIDEPSKKVDFDGPASTEFHLQNSGGFPPGDYSVDVFIDGVQVGTRAFKVGEFYS